LQLGTDIAAMAEAGFIDVHFETRRRRVARTSKPKPFETDTDIADADAEAEAEAIGGAVGSAGMSAVLRVLDSNWSYQELQHLTLSLCESCADELPPLLQILVGK
jgi:hypothetical protein